ncbi:MAG TPA: GAF domain-containing protein [Kofleriaceae bacterium]
MVHIAERATPGTAAELRVSTHELAREETSTHGHLVQFYESDSDLAHAVAAFLGAGLGAGERAVVIATMSHRCAFEHSLGSAGVDVERLVKAGMLMFVDAHETLSTFMRAGEPDRDLFQAEIGGLIERLLACEPRAGLRAYGEMVDVLWTDGQHGAALALEELWNDLQQLHPFTLFCAYSMASFYKQPAGAGQVCQTHTHVVAARPGSDDGSALETAQPPAYARQLVREIVHRSEVELALRESLRALRRKEEQLRESELQLRDFIENAAVGLHQVGPDGTILWANRAELELLGYSRDEYIGRSIIDIHADRAIIDDILARLNRGEELHDYEARLRAKDGSVKHVLLSSNAEVRDGRILHTRCFTRDITLRRQAEEALHEREVQLRTITDALPVLVAYVNRSYHYELANASFERWLGITKTEIPGKHMRDVIGPAAFEVIRPYVDRAMAGEVVSYEAEVPYGTGARFVRASHIPQRNSDGRVMGVVSLVVDITEAKSFERYRAAAAERAQRLLTITSALADAVTTDEVLEAVVNRLSAATTASSVALWLLEPDGRTARLARSVGYPASSTSAFESLPMDIVPGLPVTDTILRGEPLWFLSQPSLLERYPHLAPVTIGGHAKQICCLPLISNGRKLGAIGVTSDAVSLSDDEERNFLLLVARYAGQAIERLRLLEAERRSRAEADAAAARMGVLSHASRVFVDANLDLEERMADIVGEVGRIFGGSAGIALLEGDGRLRARSVYHPVPEAQQLLRAMASGSPLSPGEGVSGTVALTGEKLLIPASALDEIAARTAPAFRSFLDQYPVRAIMCVPLRTQDRTIGTLTVSKTQDLEDYLPSDLALLDILAERAASAIENARLHHENVAARSHAEQLYRFAHAAATANNLHEVLEAGLDAIAGTLATDRAAVLLFDDSGVMRFKAWRGLSEEYRNAVEGHSPWPPDATAPQPVLVEDVEAEPSLAAYLPLFRTERIGSLAFIPLVTRGKLLGKFMLYHQERHSYSKTETELAGAVSNHLASVTARFAAMADIERTLHDSELFAGVLAHDLRNPLGAILTAAQLVLMRQEGEGDRNAKPLSRILSSGQRMGRMIDQLLDFTRARVGGGIELQARDVNLADVCNQAITELELVYSDRQIHCSIVGDQCGRWDADRLLQIVSNLLANACQHGRPGTDIAVRIDGQQPDAITLDVHNQGTIPQPLLSTLFDPFRGTRHRRDHSRGLGLGLFIVRELVRAHGGTVTVRSTEADGTIFSIRLPRHLPGTHSNLMASRP